MPSAVPRRGRLVLAGVLVGYLALRVAFLSSTLLRLDGDEAVGGIMAQRILEGHHLAFYAGQAYNGSGEQYLAAVFLWLLPDTPFTMRLPQLVLGVLSCTGVYLLGRRCLGSEWRALLAAALFAVGPFSAVVWSAKSRGAEATGMLVGICGLLLALAIRPDDGRLRSKLFGLGLAAGVGFWANWQSAYLLIPAAVWVLGTLRGELVRLAPVVVTGFCLGAAPSIGHVLLTGPLELGGHYLPSSLADRVEGLWRVALPQFVGTLDERHHPLPGWLPPAGTSLIVLGVLAVALYRHRRGLFDLVRLRSARRRPLDLLLLCAVVTPLLYVQSEAAANPYYGYLVPMYAVLPVLLAALVPGPTTPGRRRVVPAMAVAMVAVLLAQTIVLARRQFARGGGGHPVASGELVRTETLPAVVDALVASGAHSVFADYWLANPMAFLAGDRLVVSSIYTRRFPDVTAAANCDPSPALVVPVGPPADALRGAIAAAGSSARESHVAGLALFTNIGPGLRPGQAFAMRDALEPAVPGPSCRSGSATPPRNPGGRPLA
ncbi:MAG: glycosyltransferase family 39 protein [Actinomycetota bacterium]|nr:glycosyltransferase family 39 protein [Actinomycetota bacterium]